MHKAACPHAPLPLQDLLPGAAGMLKAGGGRLLHNLPPLKGKSTANGSSGGKLAPVAAPILSQVSAPGPLPSTSQPQSSNLKSGVGEGRGQLAGSFLSRGGGVSLSPAPESAESTSPGLAYLKSPVQQTGLCMFLCVFAGGWEKRFAK